MFIIITAREQIAYSRTEAGVGRRPLRSVILQFSPEKPLPTRAFLGFMGHPLREHFGHDVHRYHCQRYMDTSLLTIVAHEGVKYVLVVAITRLARPGVALNVGTAEAPTPRFIVDAPVSEWHQSPTCIQIQHGKARVRHQPPTNDEWVRTSFIALTPSKITWKPLVSRSRDVNH